MTTTRPLWIGAALFAAFAVGCDGGPEPLAPSFARPSRGPSLTATAASPTQIDLAWVNDAKTILQFDIYRSTTGASGAFTLLATVGPTVRTFSDQGLRTATEYCYRVRSLLRNGKGVLTESFTTTACATTLTPSAPPDAPSDVTAAPSMLVVWTDNATDEDGFRIERSTDGGAWVTAITVGPNLSSAWEPWSLVETVVCYRVFAFNAAGDSPASNTNCTALPLDPGPFGVISLDATTFDLVWEDNSQFEDGYEVLGAYCDLWSGSHRPIAVLPANATSFRFTLAYLEEEFAPILGPPGGHVGYYSFYVRALKDSWLGPMYEEVFVWPYGEGYGNGGECDYGAW